MQMNDLRGVAFALKDVAVEFPQGEKTAAVLFCSRNGTMAPVRETAAVINAQKFYNGAGQQSKPRALSWLMYRRRWLCG